MIYNLHKLNNKLLFFAEFAFMHTLNLQVNKLINFQQS